MSIQPNDGKSYKLVELIDYYEICNRAEGKSPKTLSWYSANLRSFNLYLRSRHIPDETDNIDIRLLRNYVLYLFKRNSYQDHPYTPTKDTPLSTATVHGHVRTLRAFFSWLLREEFIQVNPTTGLKPPKLDQKVITILSDEEIRTIINTFNRKQPSDARNQTIFMILFDAGLRIGEIIRLKMDDLHLDEGIIKVLGKGKKERFVPIGSNSQKVLQRYLFRYRPRQHDSQNEHVFLSIGGKPLTENSLKLMFSRLARRSGVKRLHAHLCRHTFATKFLINGGDVFTLQQILGHSTLEMVRHYVNLASNQVALQHRRYSPLDRLNLRK
jgi:integrase/recombinase XerC/integrase/recombinase XerD